MKTSSEGRNTWALYAALLVTGLAMPNGASAESACPQGLWASRGTCCEVGREYVASRNECMVVRPERRCLTGHLDDCVKAARELEREGSMGPSYAAELYRFACDEGYAPACRGLGAMYRTGKGLDKDEQRGRALYQQACSSGDAPACTQLARWMLESPAEAHAALPLLVEACHRGDAPACAMVAEKLAAQFPEQRTEHGLYMQLACEGGLGNACLALLERERREAFVAPDRERALLERACDASDAEGCVRLGDAYRDGLIAPQNSVSAAKQYTRACEAGHVGACMRLAELTVEGEGVRRDLRHAAELYGRMCGAGVSLACERRAWVEAEQGRERVRSAKAH